MRTAIETQIRSDAEADPAFRAALIADADQAIAERYGMGIPEGLNVRVVEEAADEVVLVLPVDRSDMQFSEADLDVAASAGAIYVPDKKTYADCM
jgi:hypothetical protein